MQLLLCIFGNTAYAEIEPNKLFSTSILCRKDQDWLDNQNLGVTIKLNFGVIATSRAPCSETDMVIGPVMNWTDETRDIFLGSLCETHQTPYKNCCTHSKFTNLQFNLRLCIINQTLNVLSYDTSFSNPFHI